MARYNPIDPFADLQPGDQIATRSLSGNLHPSLQYLCHAINSNNYYYHHGVYLGNLQVIHFYGETSADARPCRIGLWQFIQRGENNELYRVDHEGQVLPVNETLKTAEEVLVKDESNGEERWPKFNIICNNCESLASWLKTGRQVSYQAQEVIIAGVIAGVAIGGSIAGSRHYTAMKKK